MLFQLLLETKDQAYVSASNTWYVEGYKCVLVYSGFMYRDLAVS